MCNVKTKSTLSMLLKQITALSIAALTLTGCYVEVSHEHEAYVDTEVTYANNITDYSTKFLVDAALIPFVLTAESPYMVINPDSYTTPRTRNLSRALITETTYAYLFDNWDCDYGGYTQTEAEANTTSYDDGYTFVELFMSANANDCEVVSQGSFHLVNSNVNYDVSGWYDDWEHEVSSMEAELTGSVQIDYNGKFISHSGMNFEGSALSASDFTYDGSSTVVLDDGVDIQQVTMTTRNDVHIYLGMDHPHAGKIRFKQFDYDVTLEFDSQGVTRTDSNSYSRYRTWSELGF
jgi:hypothetical protein